MLLGLDLGTTNVKALVVAEDGRIAARGSAPVELVHVEDGGVEQSIEEIFSAVLDAIADVGSRADLSVVKAIGVSSQGGALQVLDSEGQPVGQVISWLDARGNPYSERVARELGRDELARRSGHARGTMAFGQLLRLRDQQPELLAPPHRIGLVGDVVVWRLCGRRAHDATSLSCAVLYNPSTRSADPELLARIGITEDQLPDLVSPREPAGGLLAAVAKKASLPPGIPVSAAVHDQYASAVGIGATTPGDVMFGAGTAWVLLALTDRLMPPVAGVGFSCTHVVEGVYGQILSLVNGGSALSWALELTGQGGRDQAGLDAALESTEPGSDGLRFRPLLVPGGGAGLPANAAGGLSGLRLSHGRPHVLRAVVEGLVMELARYLHLMVQAGMPVERLIMCGGATASRVTPQIVADATGLPVACTTEYDASALGAAVIARGLLEPGRSLAEFSADMAAEEVLLEPGPNARLYQRMAAEYRTAGPCASTNDL